MLSRTLLALALMGCLSAAEPVVATPFEVRKEAQELLDELARGQAGDDPSLLNRARTMLLAHGGKLLASGEGARPIADLLIERLSQRGLIEACAEAFGPGAERALGEARTEAELLAVAQGNPFTSAALTAWGRLADRAWDSGRLGTFLEFAARAGDSAAQGPRAARFAAARVLVTKQATGSPPQKLTGLDEMWRLERDGKLPPGSARLPAFARRRNQPGIGAPPLAFSAPAGDLCAAGDGVRLMVFDLLVGRQIGQVQSLGRDALLGRRQVTPAVLPDGFVATGLVDQTRLTVVCVDRLGAVRWRVTTPSMGYNPQVSAPVVVDGLVAVAMVKADEGAADLVVQAWHAKDGSPAWECLVARLASANPWMVGGEAYLGPTLAVAAGRLIVASNNGLVARVDPSGVVRRLWTYQSIYDNQANAFSRPDPVRLGGVASDGLTAVVTPADAEALALIIPPEGDPLAWRGDGAAGDVVAMADGVALLAGLNSVTALEVAPVKARWSLPGPPGGGDAQGSIGDGRGLVAARGGAVLYDLVQGKVLDQRPFDRPTGIASGEGVLLLGAEDNIAAFGAAGPLAERLMAAAAAAPADWRPLTALASVAAARGEAEKALDHYEAALKRGAPAEYAERAARLLRLRLDVADVLTMPGLIARLERLGGGNADLIGETRWWQGRLADLSNDRIKAVDMYRQAAAAPDRLIEIRDRLAVSLRYLATTAIARPNQLPGQAAPAILAIPKGPDRDWQRPLGAGRAVAAGDRAACYSDGVLAGIDLATGTESWWRKPTRPLLGVQMRGEPAAEGIGLTVFAGTAAASAGMRTGDVLTQFAGQPMRDFAGDLVPAVVRLGVRSAFKATILRGGRELQLEGRLGGELVEPIAANQRTLLAWPTLVQGGRPEGLWFAAHDVQDGTELWRHALPPVSQDGTPPAPLLTPDDLVICPEGADLLALAVRPGANGEAAGREIWRLPGQATQLALARIIDGRWLWLPEPDRERTSLVDVRDGRLLAQLPVDGVRLPLIVDGEVLISRGEGAGLALCDLARARVRWIAPVGNPVAAAGDAVLVLDPFERLQVLDRASGAVRRTIGELGTVHTVVTAGSQLLVHHSPAAAGHAIGAVDPATGTVRWTMRLPDGIEVVAMAARGTGCGVVVADRTASGPLTWLAINAEGAVTGWGRWDATVEGGRLQVLERGAMLSAVAGIHAVVEQPVALAPAVDFPRASGPDEKNWRAITGGGVWNAWRSDSSLTFAIRGPAIMRLADRGQEIDARGWALSVPAKGPASIAMRGDDASGWRISAQEVREFSGQGQVTVVTLVPPPMRLAGRPLAVRVTAEDGPDSPPWWLVGNWAPAPGLQ